MPLRYDLAFPRSGELLCASLCPARSRAAEAGVRREPLPAQRAITARSIRPPALPGHRPCPLCGDSDSAAGSLPPALPRENLHAFNCFSKNNAGLPEATPGLGLLRAFILCIPTRSAPDTPAALTVSAELLRGAGAGALLGAGIGTGALPGRESPPPRLPLSASSCRGVCAPCHLSLSP